MNASNPKKSEWQRRVAEKCRECIYDQFGGMGTWRQQIEACASVSCPLHPIRPVSETFRKEEAA